MKDFSFYEQVGVILPGAALLAGLIIAFPQLQPVLVNKDVSVGELGLFVIFSYVAGHFVAAFGNLLELALWSPFGGMPSNWPRRSSPRIMTTDQRDRLQAKIKARLGPDVAIDGCDSADWRHLFGQIYRDVVGTATPKRVEAFNGNYGLNRGLSSAMFISAVLVFLIPNGHPWWWALVAAVAGLVFSYRAYRFGVHFAQEVYFRFLNKPDS